MLRYKRQLDWERLVSASNRQDLNAYAGALYHLGTERHFNHRGEDKMWIMTVHDASEDGDIRKTVVDQFMVVSIPAATESQKKGFGLYATHNNSWVMKAADLDVSNGNYDKALQTYNLLRRYSVRNTFTETLDEKMAIVTALKQGNNVEANRKLFDQTVVNLSPSVFERIEVQPLK